VTPFAVPIAGPVPACLEHHPHLSRATGQPRVAPFFCPAVHGRHRWRPGVHGQCGSPLESGLDHL